MNKTIFSGINKALAVSASEGSARLLRIPAPPAWPSTRSAELSPAMYDKIAPPDTMNQHPLNKLKTDYDHSEKSKSTNKQMHSTDNN